MSKPNIRRIARINAKPEQADATRAALIELQQATVAESGCREFIFFQALTAPTAFLLIEDFANEQALETHMQQPHTKAFFARELTASISLIDREWTS